MSSLRKIVVAVAAIVALSTGGAALADPPSVYEGQLTYADTYAGVGVHMPVAAPDGVLIRSWERSAASFSSCGTWVGGACQAVTAPKDDPCYQSGSTAWRFGKGPTTSTTS